MLMGLVTPHPCKSSRGSLVSAGPRSSCCRWLLAATLSVLERQLWLTILFFYYILLPLRCFTTICFKAECSNASAEWLVPSCYGINANHHKSPAVYHEVQLHHL